MIFIFASWDEQKKYRIYYLWAKLTDEDVEDVIEAVYKIIKLS